MEEKVLIVEDQFIEADHLRMMLAKAGYEVTGIANSVAKAQELIKQERPDFVLLDIFLKGKLTGIDLAWQLGEENIAFVYLSASSNEEVLTAAKATQPYGFLVKPFREKDLLITLEIARYRHEHSMEAYFRSENVLKNKLSAIGTNTDSWEKKLSNIGRTLQPYIPFDYLTAGFNIINASPSPGLSFLRIGYDEYQKIGIPELMNITGLKMDELTTLANRTTYNSTTTIYSGEKFEQMCLEPSMNKLFSKTFQVKSNLLLPLHLLNGEVFIFSFYSRKPDIYNSDHTGLLDHIQKPVAASIETMLGAGAVKKTVTTDSSELPEAAVSIVSSHEFEGIVGKSHLLLNVLDMITQVAPFDTSVLILGESGTGKERVADCIHNLSPRRNKPFIKVNCTALPSTLIESELFGYEKGSFTGALDKRIGKFEKADKGTIFLDEIGDMPVDLQVKLLRVLQEKEIEPIGSRSPIKVDVRVIAATNKKLEREVAEGRFRLDLYYRLNVFPIELPPLRERAEDIPALANHFVNYYNRKAGKKISGLTDGVMKNMMTYHWPGNIRELENIIERSVLLTKGSIIEEISLPSVQRDISADKPGLPMKTIHENERDYIMAVLKKCDGRIWGAGGAAEILNIPPSTLKSKMKKLGIKKENTE